MNNISDDQNTISEIVGLKFVEDKSGSCSNCYYRNEDCDGIPCTGRKDGKSGIFIEVL
jgi:hypothetical protein